MGQPNSAGSTKTVERTYRPHRGQQEFHDSTARFRVLACGARWGKDIASIEDSLAIGEYLLKNKKPSPEMNPLIHFWTVGPTFPVLRQFWRDLHGLMPSRWQPKWDKSKMSVECFGGRLLWEFKSADTPESLVAVGLDLVVITEGGLIADAAWEAYLRPRLITPGRLGFAIINGTPKGKGTWYEDAFLRGQPDDKYAKSPTNKQDPEWWSINEPTYKNSYVRPEEVESLVRNMPELWRRQEVDAEFLSGEGVVFRGIHKCVIQDEDILPDGQWVRPIYIGVDWGRKQDFTVFTAMDSTWRILDMDRMSEISYNMQRARLRKFVDRFRADGVITEVNSIGDPLAENLRDEIPCGITEFYTTNTSKRKIVEGFALAVERERTSFPRIPVFINEMEAFEMNITTHGNVTYAAGGRHHDDTIISACLAHYGHGGWQDEYVAPVHSLDAPKMKLVGALPSLRGF